jgi:hypothetical protein
VCSTKYITVASLSNKIHLSVQTVSNRIHQWTVACVQQIHHSCHWVQQNTLAVASVFNKIWQVPVCSTKYMTGASVFNKIYDRCQCVQQNIWQLPVRSTKYMTVASVFNKIYDSFQCVQQNIWQLPVCSTKYDSFQCVQQNIWQLPVCSTKYDSCQCVQQNIWQLPVCSTKYMTVASCQQTTPQCEDSVQQNTPDSVQSPVSNKICGSCRCVQQNIPQTVEGVKMWQQVIDCHRPWQTRCKVLCQPTSLTDGHGFYDYVLMSPLPGTVAAAVNFQTHVIAFECEKCAVTFKISISFISCTVHENSPLHAIQQLAQGRVNRIGIIFKYRRLWSLRALNKPWRRAANVWCVRVWVCVILIQEVLGTATMELKGTL